MSLKKLYRIWGRPEKTHHTSNQNSLRFRFSEQLIEKKFFLVSSMKFSKCACGQDGTWLFTRNWKCKTKCHAIELYIFVDAHPV